MTHPDEPYPVLVVDDDALFRSTLVVALRGEGFDAADASASCLPHVFADPERRPGLVLLDLGLGPDAEGTWLHGADLVAGIRNHGWTVLVVSSGSDRPGIAAAIAAGAVGTVSKTRPFTVLLDAMRTAARGGALMTAAEHEDWIDLHRCASTEERDIARRVQRLSGREREVLEMLADGADAEAVAQHLAIDARTVRHHVRSVVGKLEVAGRLDAVALLRRHVGAADDRRRHA